MKAQNKVKGQILIIFALAIVAILGMTALGVDGSMILNEKRKDQSTADSAALAAAGAAAQYLKTANVSGFNCGTTISANAATAAINSAKETALEDNINLTTNDLSISGVTTACGDDNGRKYLEVTVRVTTDAPTAFLKVVRSSPIRTIAESVTRVYVNLAFAGGNALVSTGTTCDANGGIYALGDGQIRITGGGAYSASCIEATRSSKIYAYGGVINYTGSGNLITPQNEMVLILNDVDPLTAPNISDSLAPQIDWYGPNRNIDPSLIPTQASAALASLTIPVMVPQNCSTLPTQYPTLNWQSETLSPGYYPNGITQGSGALTLKKGIYCIGAGKSVSFTQRTVTAPGTIFYFEGSGSFTIGGANTTNMDNSSIYLTNGDFKVGNGGSLNATNITIYIKQGNFTVDGGAIVNLYAPGCNTSACGVGPSIPGVLLYMDKNNTGSLTIDNGTSDATPHHLNGTMFAPNACALFSGGTATSTLNVQLIAKRIQADSGAKLNMTIDDATLYSQASTTIQMYR